MSGIKFVGTGNVLFGGFAVGGTWIIHVLFLQNYGKRYLFHFESETFEGSWYNGGEFQKRNEGFPVL